MFEDTSKGLWGLDGIVGETYVERLHGVVGASGQVSRGSAGEYQADEQAGVARLRWRVSGR